MQRQRWIVLFGWLGVMLALLGAAYPIVNDIGSSAAAQQDGTAPTTTTESSPEAVIPEASPSAATPVAGLPADGPAPIFLTDRWRIALTYAAMTADVPLLELESRSGRDWVVVIADVTNWSTEDDAFAPASFGIRAAGEEEGSGFARQTTEDSAERLEIEPRDIGAGVEIDAGDTTRLVLVFRILSTDAELFLAYNGDELSLTLPFARGGSLDRLPEIVEAPELDEIEITDVLDGASLEVDDDPVRLAGVDAPREGECFAGQATTRLERLAGDEALVEDDPDSDAVYVWIEDEDGIRTLLNNSVIAAGSAAFLEGTTGAFAALLAESDRQARTDLAGLWGACTSQHGTGRSIEPETSSLALRSDGETRPYAPWVAWSPLIVTKPDGTAWIFFSAEPTEGGDAGNKRLYYSRYDTASGNWSTARAMRGGEVQMGPSAVVDQDGVVHVVFCDRAEDVEGVFSEIMYTKENGEGGWTDPVPVARLDSSGYQLSPSLAIDREGGLHVSWQDQRAFAEEARDASPSNADIFVSDLGPDGVWTIPVLVNTHYSDAVASRPQIVADGDRLVAIWSVYAAEIGLNAAVRVEWSTRPLDGPFDWTPPQPLVVGRGESFGGRLLDLEADPTGGVVFVYGRQANDTFLFLRRLAPGASEWGGDTLLTFGDRGTFPSVTISQEGVVYVVYNVGNAGVVDVGAVAIPYRSIQPGPEVVLTADQENTQGRPIVATDVTGRPWIVYFSEPPGGAANEVRVLRNAEIPVVAQDTDLSDDTASAEDQ